MASYTEDSVELREIMGKNIRERREGCGLSQSQLGKAIGSTQSYISTIENGSGSRVSCVKLYSIAQELNVSMHHINKIKSRWIPAAESNGILFAPNER